MHMGASTVKWIAPNPCLGLSESDAKLYTNFEFCKANINRHIKQTY